MSIGSQEFPEYINMSIGSQEFAEYGNCQVYIANNGVLDSSWTLEVGSLVLIRSVAGGWYWVKLEKDDTGWFTTCGDIHVPVVWSDQRNSWVSTVPV